MFKNEKRKFPRVVFPCKIILDRPFKMLSTYTENMSAGGVRVVLDRKLKQDSIISMDIFIKKNNPIKCEGCVVWVLKKENRLNKNTYDTGVEFTDIEEYDRNCIEEMVDEIIRNKGNKE